MSNQIINGIWSYVDDGLDATFGSPPIDSMTPANTVTSATKETLTPSLEYTVVSENLLPGRNTFYETKKHLIIDRPNGYVLNGKNAYFYELERGEGDDTTVYNALLVEFASFSGRPYLLKDKFDTFKYFLETLWKSIKTTSLASKIKFFMEAYEDALKMGNLASGVIYKEMYIRTGDKTWHVKELYGNTTGADVAYYWLEPFYDIIGQTSTTSTAQPINIAVPVAPTTAENLSYRVGREDDNEGAIKAELLANLANLPEKPAQKVAPTIPTPTKSFTSSNIQGTRFITLPVNADYTLRLLDRFENEIMAVPYNASQKRIELPINTLGSFYEIVPSKQRFYIHNGKGELLFEDASKRLDFAHLQRFCFQMRDRKAAFVVAEYFLKDLSDYLLGVKKHYDVEVVKGIELFLYVFERNRQRGKNYLECEMIDVIDRELAKI